MHDILHLLRIHAAPERVYQALTTAEGIHNWWTREAELDSRIGGAGEFRFYEGKGITRIRVDELEPSRRVGWTTISANAPGGWEGTRISFDLRAEGDDTVLSFAHRGFREAGEGYALVNTGWAYYLVSLQQYVETGRGWPQQDKNFASVFNGRDRRTTEILLSLDIAATPERLYEALTTQEGLAGWWTPEAKAEPRVGAVNEFGFAGLARLAFRVDALEPGRHVAWSAMQVPPDWQGTRIAFDITPAEKSVNLRFSQTGFAHPYEHFGMFSYLWAQYMRSLKLLAETGAGEPFGSPGSKAARTTPP